MSRRGLVLFAAMSVIWGIPYLFIRIAVDEISPAVLVFGRTAIATALLLPFALLRLDLRPILARWRWVVAFAVIEIAIPWVLLATAEQRLSSSLTGLLIAGTPLAGVVIAYLTGGDRLGRTALFGLLLGLVGVIAIVGADFRVDGAGSLLALLGVVICYALGPAILARQLGGLPSVGIMALSLAGTAVLYAPVAAAQWPATTPSRDVLISVLVLGTVCTAAAFLVFAALIDEIGPVRATVITYVNPAVAAVLGVVVLGEVFTLAMAVGFALVIAGSAISTRRPTTTAATEPRPDASTEPRLGSA
jgi:drug/metabolite transporter (DMT)-like permease